MYIRLITLIVLIIGSFIAPWWSVMAGLVICVLVYRRFIEGLIPAVIIDVLYGAEPIFGINGFLTCITAVLIVLVIISEHYFRSHVRL